MTLSIGIDIGGTFTDVVSMDAASGHLQYTKVSSTPPELVKGFVQGIDRVLALASASYGEISRIVHGTTIG
ncbi:MAG: hydantoinase/oxoprolinase N-terminal domain-containing protein, partial [Dehalococcoidia bacterium]